MRGMIFTALAPAILIAQSSTTVTGPTVLANVDGKSAVRPIYGIASSSSLGDPLDLGPAAVQAAVAPNQAYILVQRDDRTWTVANAAAPLDAAIQGDLAAFSRTGSSALFRAAAANTVAAVSGLPASPRAITLSIPEGSQAVAIADDGATILAISDTEVNVLSAANQSRTPGFRHIAAAAFLPNSTDALILDSAAGTLTRIGAAGQSVIATGLADATAVATSLDGKRIYVAAGQNILTFGDTPESANCICTPAELTPIGPDLFIIAGRNEPGSLWLFSRTRDGGQAYFASKPAIAPKSTEAAQ